MLDSRQKPSSEQATIQDKSIQAVESKSESQVPPVWPPPPRPRPRQGVPLFVKVLTITLALLLVLGGLGFVVYAATNQYGLALGASRNWNSRAIINSQATVVNSLAQTAQPLATSQAQIVATATAEVQATVTAQATGDLATATTTAMQNLLTQKTDGTPNLDDALSDNSENNQWDVGRTDNNATGCNFVNSSYEVQEVRQGFLQQCFADATDFSNFVYQVSMTISTGDQGGIIFRGHKDKGQYYLFRIDTNGNYALDLYNGNKYTSLLSGASSAILAGGGQSNDLAVIADKDSLSLFINTTYVGNIANKTLKSGQIGVAAINISLPTAVDFSNAQVWKLS
ncbi:MAG TPA: hypothetical protein VFN35_10260 [Ktedonobacteraceae bacterium]|nr:hypothetical protein [Ktedonobacteraceae bacterium]